MATTFLALEISEQNIRHVILEKKAKSLVFAGAGVSAVTVDPSAPGALSLFIKEFMAKHNLAISRIFITLNRQDIIIHQITLSATIDTDLGVVIPSEIERMPAFAEHDYDYIHRVYEAENNKNRIIFVALQDAWIQYLLKEIEDIRIPCRELEILPLNLTQLLVAPEFMEGVQGLIVLTKRSTYAIIFQEQQIKFFYTTNTGKDHLYPGDGAKIDKMASARWGDEIKRVFKSYMLDAKQESIHKTWLLWDQEGASTLDKYVREELNLDTRKIHVDQIPSNIDWGAETNPYYILSCVPVIHAINKIKPHFSLNHFLRSLQAGQQLQRFISASLGLIIAAGIILGLVNAHLYKVETFARNAYERSQAETKGLEQQHLDTIKTHDEYTAAREQLLSQATYVQVLNRMSWSEVLGVVALELPAELSLTSFKVNEAGAVTINGNAFRMESIAAMLRKIETSAMLENGKFSNLTAQDIGKKKVFSFGILARIKPGEAHE